MSRAVWVGIALAVLGGAVAVIGVFVAPAHFFRAYLTAYVYWLGLSLGCLALAMLHWIAGGRWGWAILRFLEAGITTLPLLLILFVPLLFGLPHLYVWLQPDVVAADPVLQHKQAYLNLPFFLIRAAIYFVTWLGLAFVLLRRSRAQVERPAPDGAGRLQRFSAVGLVVLGFTTSFAAIDWLMSLEPHWHSTIYSAMVGLGAVLSAFALVTALVGLNARQPPLASFVTPRVLNDLGSLLLAFVMLWAWLAYSQFLVIWYGNVPEEVAWYVRRITGGWLSIVLVVIALDFALPFMLLAVRDVKRSAGWLASIALLVFVVRYVDVYWLVMPAFGPVPLAAYWWLDLAVPLALGGAWMAWYAWRLPHRPALPERVLAERTTRELEHAPAQ